MKLKIFNSGINVEEDIKAKSVFLAGPSERDDSITPWRTQAVSLFEKFGFDGHIYIPEPWSRTREVQINWEVYHLNIAKCILFWIPRNLKTLPGFTTNIEFGEWMHSKKVVLGFPADAEKMEYIEYRARMNDVPISDTLENTVKNAIMMTEENLNLSLNDDYKKIGEKL